MTATKEHEDYLFKVAQRVLHWADVDYTDEELADLVMLELLNYKLPKQNNMTKQNNMITKESILIAKLEEALPNYEPSSLFYYEYTIYSVLSELDMEITVDFYSKQDDVVCMLSYYSNKLGKTIVLTYDFSADTIEELSDELLSYEKQAEEIEIRLPHLSPVA